MNILKASLMFSEAFMYLLIKIKHAYKVISSEAEDIEPLLDKALYNLNHVDERYQTSDITHKRQIIGSIFPEKLIFEDNVYRIIRVNEAVKLICSIGKAFQEKKKGQTSDVTSLSQEVVLPGIEPGSKV